MAESNAQEYDEFAPFYDLWVGEDGEEDLSFYVDEALKAPGPVLELGFGTGRIGLAIADAGKRVIGVDHSKKMLEIAGQRLASAGTELADRVRLVHDSLDHFTLDERFELAIMPFRTLLHLLTPDEKRAALENIRRHLQPGGRLIFNVFLPDPVVMSQYDNRTVLHDEYRDPETGHEFSVWEHYTYDHQRQLICVRITVEELNEAGVSILRKRFVLTMSYMSRFEVEHLLQLCGFQVESLYGDFEGNPLTRPDQWETVWVARNPG